MDRVGQIIDIISANKWRMGVLRLVQDLGLPDWWIGGGFVRNAVWDHFHGKSMTPLNDIDVIYFDAARPDPKIDESIRMELEARGSRKPWSVSNQARMHLATGDAPYTSCEDAMRHWPETATAVAVTLADDRVVRFTAPHGPRDLYDLIVRPTSADKAALVAERAAQKRWAKQWPKLRFES